MKTARTLLLAVLLWPSAATAQLPHHIPELCAGSRDTINPGTTETWSSTQNRGCIEVRGTLIVRGRLTYDTIMVKEGGTLDIQSGAELIRRDVALNLAEDPEQFGGGILVFGRLRMTGVEKTPFLRLAAEPRAGDAALMLAGTPNGWMPGDRIVVPDTRRLEFSQTGNAYSSQVEVRTISSVSGQTVNLTAPLDFDHRGARNLSGALEFLPHVANLTRSIVLRSENRAGTRAHLLATGTADVDVRYVRFESMGRTTAAPLDCTLRTTGVQTEPQGRICTPGEGPITRIGTNQIGRYAFHAHHLDGPPGLGADVPQFRLEGSVFEDSRKWPIAIHNTHYGLVSGNVMYGWAGAGLMTEDGSETGNVIQDNFALAGLGGGGGRDGLGREGVGFYFRGPSNIVRRNVSASVMPAPGNADSAYGFKYYLVYLPDPMPVPVAKGDRGRRRVNPYTLPVTEFHDNEAYGATESGLTYWWIGTFGSGFPRTHTRSFLRNFRVWNVYNKGIFQYEVSMVTVDGFVARNVPLGIDGADYYANETEYYRLDIEGNSGILVSSSVPTPMLVANSRFRTTGPAISMRTLWTSASRADWIGPRQVALQNVSFVPPPSGLHRAISMQFRAEPTRNLIARDEIRVQASNMGSFRVYYAEQRPSFVIPQTVANSDGTPSLLGVSSAGLTNQQAFSQFKVAIAGSVAPCATTVPQIEGLVCDGVATAPAPGDPPVNEPPGSDPPPPGADPPPPPSDGAGPCTVSEWGAWGPWSEWKVVRHLMMRIRVRTRTIINPGSAVPRLCPSLTDTETEVMPFERTEAAASGGHH